MACEFIQSQQTSCHHFWDREPSLSAGEYSHKGEVVLSNFFNELDTSRLLSDARWQVALFFPSFFLTFFSLSKLNNYRKKKKRDREREKNICFIYILHPRLDFSLWEVWKLPQAFGGFVVLWVTTAGYSKLVFRILLLLFPSTEFLSCVGNALFGNAKILHVSYNKK